MDKLKFLVAALVAHWVLVAPALAGSIKFDISEFSVEGNTLLPAEKIKRFLSAFTGIGREMGDVSKAADALRALYAAAGYAVVQVTAPEQTVSSGKVVLKVIEDKITAVEVKGNSAYSADNIRASLPSLQTGRSLNAKQLEAAIVLANENSAKQVAVDVRPGTRPGDIGTIINVTEDRITKYSATFDNTLSDLITVLPFSTRITKYSATFDNTGSEATGYHKIGLAYQNANFLNRDHALTLQYNGSVESLDKVYSFSLGYHVPFYPQGVSTDFIAAYSSSSGQNGNLYFSGKGTVFGARLNYSLTSLGDIRQKLIFGIDYKDSESVSGLLITPITEVPVSLTWFAQVARPEFQGNTSASLTTNIPGGTHGSEDDYYNKSTGIGARMPISGPASDNFPQTNWHVLRINGSGGFALPNDWQARFGINSQFSGDLLLPSEQFGAGGASSVRGYPERIISGDQGYSVNLEIYTPELNKYLAWPDSSLRTLLFLDMGKVSRNDAPLLAGVDATSSITGIGVGLRLTFKKDITLKLDMGWAQKTVGSAPVTVNRGDSYGNLASSFVF